MWAASASRRRTQRTRHSPGHRHADGQCDGVHCVRSRRCYCEDDQRLIVSLCSPSVTVSDSLDRLALLDATFQNGADLVALLARDGRVLDANARALEFAGAPLEVTVGQLLWTTLGWAARPLLSAWLETAIRGAHGVQAANRVEEVVNANGTVNYVEFSVRALGDPQSNASWLQVTGTVVTEQLRNQATLRDAEARLRAALDVGADAIVVANAVRDDDGAVIDLIVVDACARAARLSDMSQADLVGRSLLGAFPLSRATGLWEQCLEVLATQTPHVVSVPAPVPDTPGRWVQRQIVPLNDGVAITSRDVTTLQREREALELSEARHRQLFEASAAIQLIANAATGALIDVNPAAEPFYGWERETMRAMRVGDFDDGALLEWMSTSFMDHDGPARAVVFTHRIASGEKRDVEVAASPVVIDGSQALHLIVHDVTERMWAERQLRESEARFRTVINDMSEGVVVHDVSGTIRVFNLEAERLLGLSAQQLEGLLPTDHDWHAVREDGTLWPAIDHPVMRALRTGRRQPRTLMGIRRGDRDHTWLQVTADPLLLAGEQLPFAAVAVFSDITEQRRTDERLREAQKLEAVGKLAGGIAHDFNNLLTVIRGASGFLAEALDAGSPAQADVRAIERATERAQVLTSRLLSVGRRQLLRVETVDLSVLVKEQTAAIRRSMPPGTRVEQALDARGVTALLDRQQAVEALSALVDNARLAMMNGGTLTLSTTLREAEASGPGGESARFAVLEVRDTGVGMTDEVRARLFEPFFSTRPFGTSHGMSLASVHGMVTQSHGSIECDSTAGHGTALRLVFPQATGDERRTTPRSSSAVFESRRVLLVDDDALLRDLASRMLERLGHEVVATASGAEALDILASRAADISALITDLTMPGMSGMELIAEVERRHPRLPILAISGFSMNADAREELHGRAIAFLPKPFNVESLTEALERMFSPRRRS